MVENILFWIFCVGFLALAGYCAWLFFRCRRWKALLSNPFLYPTDRAPEDCLDAEGFLRYTRCRVLGLGGICLVGSLAAAAVRLGAASIFFGGLVLLLTGLIVLSAYILWTGNAAKYFWP